MSPLPAFLYARYIDAWQLTHAPGCLTTTWRFVSRWSSSMVAAVVASVGLMMLFAAPIGRFVSDHPTIKMLALAFLVVVAVVLIAEGFDQHVPKGYIYFAMAFSVAVEMLNIRLRRRSRRATEVRP